METIIINTKTSSELEAIQTLANSLNLESYQSNKTRDFALALMMEESRKSGFIGAEATKEYFKNLKNEIRRNQ